MTKMFACFNKAIRLAGLKQDCTRGHSLGLGSCGFTVLLCYLLLLRLQGKEVKKVQRFKYRKTLLTQSLIAGLFCQFCKDAEITFKFNDPLLLFCVLFLV